MKIFRRILSLSFLWAVHCSSGLAQNSYDLTVYNWGVKEGLPHREINDIIQDSLGFIWLGTPQGLTRYDGYQFKVFSTRTDSLMTQNIWRIYQEQGGCFWLIPPKPVNDIDIWCPRTRKRTTFRKRYGQEVGPVLISDQVVLQSSKDETMVMHDPETRTIWSFLPNGKFKHFACPNLGKLKLFAVAETYWGIVDDHVLIELDTLGRILQQRDFGKNVSLPVWKLKAGLPQWIRTKNSDQLYEYYQIGETGEIRKVVKGKSFPNEIEGRHLPTIGEDLYLVDELNKPKLVLPDSSDPMACCMEDKVPRVSFLDRNGVCWIGNNFGLQAIAIRRDRFKKILRCEQEDENTFHAARGMLIQGDDLFVNVEHQGLYQCDLITGAVQLISHNDQNWGHFGLGKLKDGRMISGANRRIYLQDAPNGAFTRIETGFEGWSFLQMNERKVWIGTEKGLWQIELHDKRLERISGGGRFPELDNARIIQMKPENHGLIWMCSDQGLFLMNDRGEVLERFGRAGSGKRVLPDEDIRFILPNLDGTLWLATGNAGLIHFNPGQGGSILQHLTSDNGLSSNTIHAIMPDMQGKLWLSSDYGIMRVDPVSLEVKTFLHGLANVECNRLAFSQNSDGEIFFGSINGVTRFHPKDFLGQFDLPDPMMVVTRFEQFDGESSRLVDRTSALLQTGVIDLEPDDRFFLLEFALLAFPHQGEHHYAYILEGLDDTWQHSRERTLRFGRPPYGTYILRVRGQDEAGNWSGHELRFQVRVHKPFWLATWFLIMMGFLLVSSIFLFLYWRTRRLRYHQIYLKEQIEERTGTIREQNIRLENQAAELQHLDEVKSKLFANVSHELRTPLTLIMGPISSVVKSGQLSGRDEALLQNALRGSKKLRSLINGILDLSKIESGMMTLNERPVHIYGLIRRFVSQFESTARLQSINLAFESNCSHQLVVLADAEKLEKVVNNLLSNAFKHTPSGGRILLRMEEEDAIIRIVVSDTGHGIHPEDLSHLFDRYYQSKQPDAVVQGGTGIGLALVREYALLLGGEVKVESVLGQGATFTFSFPKKESFDRVEELEPESEVEHPEVIPFREEPSEEKDRPLIMIVEDNPGLLDYLRLILQDHFQLLIAAHGQEALDHLSRKTPQLILSDIMMPVMDGYQLIEQLKSKDEWRGIPLIMLTARADIQDKLKALRIGVDDYLIKPFDEGELLARIRNLIARVGQRQVETLPELSGSAMNTPHTPPPISGEDMTWLGRLENEVLAHLSEDDLTAEGLAYSLAVSRRQLFRHVKELTGMTPNEYINEVRFREARRHLEERTYNTVKAVAHTVGFRNVPYFSRQFTDRFGKRPSDYLQD